MKIILTCLMALITTITVTALHAEDIAPLPTEFKASATALGNPFNFCHLTSYNIPCGTYPPCPF